MSHADRMTFGRRMHRLPLETTEERSDAPFAAAILLAVGVLAWCASLPHIDPSQLTGLGLIGILPGGMYFAYFAIVVGFCVSLLPSTIRSPLPFLFLVALVLLLHATPAISYETLRYSWAWKHVGVVDFIMRNDALDPTARYLSAYHNWPGFFLVAASIADWLRLDALQIASLARFFPTLLNLAFVCALPAFFRTFTADRRLIWIAVALFLVGNWIGQDYFSPQGTAFLLYLCVLALLVGPLSSRARDARSNPVTDVALAILVLAMIAAIVASHQITPLFLLSALFCLAVIGRVSYGYFLFALVAELVWLFYVAEPFVAPELADLIRDFGRLSQDTVSRLADTSALSADQQLVSFASRGLSAVIALGALAGLVIRYREGHRDLTAVTVLVAPMPILFVTPYGGEIVFRLYLFTLPLLAFFTASLFVPWSGKRATWRFAALGTALVVMIPAFLLANNGKDEQYWFSPAEVAAADFLYAGSQSGQLLIEGSRSYPSQFRNYENFTYVPLSDELPEVREELLTAPDRLVVRWLRSAPDGGYVIITRSQKAMFDALGLLPKGALAQMEQTLVASPDLTVVFANADATILSLTVD